MISMRWPVRSAKKCGQRFAVVEIDRDKDGARNVLLVDVELLEKCAEDGTGPLFSGAKALGCLRAVFRGLKLPSASCCSSVFG